MHAMVQPDVRHATRYEAHSNVRLNLVYSLPLHVLCTKFSKIVQITTVPVLLGHTKFSRSPNTCTGLVLYWQIAVYTLIVYQSWIGVLVSW